MNRQLYVSAVLPIALVLAGCTQTGDQAAAPVTTPATEVSLLAPRPQADREVLESAKEGDVVKRLFRF
ncbi:hypothetical protein HW450_07935 [Corynebacterium hindlerae]|uniref:Uncharacterized protein n=1 Tax=Corynebacterium hindlerae TaxID=699041 RepID=A0A7G5FCG5_9CORY|nr:hypothetical protein [Corynebacterium hindlerae]QMV84306.1 hypothetical protein HW450_07935 [Corynebacterium hindlerae]